MKRVFTRENRFEVIAMRTLLASHGIDSLLKNEHTSSVMGEIPFFEVWPEIWVADELVAEARSIIEQAQQEPLNQPKDWICSQCHEENPGTFDLCWQCNFVRTEVETL